MYSTKSLSKALESHSKSYFAGHEIYLCVSVNSKSLVKLLFQKELGTY